MTHEQLLAPRYEVIGLWPINCPYFIGYIINQSDNLEGASFFKKIDLYPHLFRRLNWWEKREASEMPEYVNLGGDILPVYYSTNKDGSLFLHGENISFSVGNIYYQITPATLEEYTNYINKNK